MGACCSKKNVPEVEIKPDIKNNKCLSLKDMLCNCFDCDNDTCISSCCVIQNISNQVEKEVELKKSI